MVAQDPSCWWESVGSILKRRLPMELHAEIDQVVAGMDPMSIPISAPHTPAKRRAANLEALEEAKKAKPNLFRLQRYSGWGGLTLRGVPRGLVTAEAQEHDYHTPIWVAWLMARLARLYMTRSTGLIKGLEPSAGIGRLILPFFADHVTWTAIEQQKGASKILRPLLKTLGGTVHTMSFEEWAAENGAARFDLIVENPPYGSRPNLALDPTHRKEKSAQKYFITRSAGMLSDGGVLVALVPSGLLSGVTHRLWRRQLLQQVELMEAFALPADIFPGAMLNVDTVCFRRRDAAWSAKDDRVVEGKYFTDHPDRLLGTVKGTGQWKVRTGWRGCLELGPRKSKTGGRSAGASNELHHWAQRLVDRPDRGIEWRLDVDDWRNAAGALIETVIGEYPDLQDVGVGRVPVPTWADKSWSMFGKVDLALVAGQADTTVGEAEAQLKSAGWMELGGEWYPSLDRLHGDLGPVLRAAEAASRPEVAAAIEKRLSGRSPVAGVQASKPWEYWIPQRVVRAWIRKEYGRVPVLKAAGVWVIGGSKGTLLTALLNYDPALVRLGDGLADEIKGVVDTWQAFTLDPSHRRELLNAYRDAWQSWSRAPLDDEAVRDELPRWDFNEREPHYFQWSHGKRAAAEGRYLFGFGVGLGKTTTMLVTLALMRSRGLIRRPVIVVPPAVLPGWIEDFRTVLPSYRVGVVGRHFGDDGTSRPDRAAERVKVWSQLKRGELDVVITTKQGMAKTRIDVPSVVAALKDDPVATRTFFSYEEAMVYDRKKGKMVSKLRASEAPPTERALAVETNKARAFLSDILTRTRKPDEIEWTDIGVDCMFLDEAHHYKSLHKAQASIGERGMPLYAGGGGASSQSAWHAFARARVADNVFLATATPAPNGLVDLFNTTQLLRPVWPENNISAWVEEHLETEEVLKESAAGSVMLKSTVTGLKNPDHFFGVLDRFASFLRVDDIQEEQKARGLRPGEKPFKVPDSNTEPVWVTPSSQQLARIGSEYEALIRAAVGRDGGSMLAIRSRLQQMSLHDDLVVGDAPEFAHWSVEQKAEYVREQTRLKALRPKRAPPSDKFRALRAQIGDQKCGHIVFIDFRLAQEWLAQYLIAEGFKVGQIHGDVELGERHEVSQRFNEGELDIVILGNVGAEGINLQKRTCSIHHMTLPWTPAALEQRNGRAVRQGNPLDVVGLFYYLLTPGPDSLHWQVLSAKGDWLQAFIGRDPTANPSGAMEVDVGDMLAQMSFNSEKWDKALADMRSREDKERKLRQEQQRARRLRSARRMVLAGSAPPDAYAADLTYPVEEAAVFSREDAVELKNAEGRMYFSAPGLMVSLETGLAIVERGHGAKVYLRRYNSWAILEGQDLVSEPAPSKPEDPETLLEEAGRTGFVAWATIDEETVTKVWAVGAPSYGPGVRVPRLGRNAEEKLVLGQADGEVVPPTSAGWTKAAAAERELTAKFHLLRQWWRRPLTPKATLKQRKRYERRLMTVTAHPGYRAEWPKDSGGAYTSLQLGAPYGPAGSEEELAGPGWGEVTRAGDPVDLKGRIQDDLMLSAEVARECRYVGPGAYAAATLLPDNLWRPSVSSEGVGGRLLWVGGTPHHTPEEAIEEAVAVYTENQARHSAEAMARVCLPVRDLAHMVLWVPRGRAVLGFDGDVGGYVMVRETGDAAWTGWVIEGEGEEVPALEVMVADLTALLGDEGEGGTVGLAVDDEGGGRLSGLGSIAARTGRVSIGKGPDVFRVAQDEMAFLGSGYDVNFVDGVLVVSGGRSITKYRRSASADFPDNGYIAAVDWRLMRTRLAPSGGIEMRGDFSNMSIHVGLRSGDRLWSAPFHSKTLDVSSPDLLDLSKKTLESLRGLRGVEHVRMVFTAKHFTVTAGAEEVIQVQEKWDAGDREATTIVVRRDDLLRGLGYTRSRGVGRTKAGDLVLGGVDDWVVVAAAKVDHLVDDDNEEDEYE